MSLGIMYCFIIGWVIITLSLIWNIRSYKKDNWGIQWLTTATLVAGIVMVCVAYVFMR